MSPCSEICSRTCEAHLEAIYEHVYKVGQAEVQNLTLDFVSNKSPLTAATLSAKVRETVCIQKLLTYIPAYMKTLR